MNKVILIGRLTKDPQAYEKTTKYTLAVDRRYKKEGEQGADFISCVTFGKQKEFADKWLHKGTKIAIAGHIQTGSYTKDGQSVYTTDVAIDEHYFCESKSQQTPQTTAKQTDDFMVIPPGEQEELPFV